MNIIETIEKESLRENVPQFSVGDTVRVLFKVIEGNKERIQAYEGIVIARKHGELEKPLQLDTFRAVSAWREPSTFTRPKSTRLKLFARAKSTEQNCIIFALAQAKRQRSKKQFNFSKKINRNDCFFFFCMYTLDHSSPYCLFSLKLKNHYLINYLFFPLIILIHYNYCKLLLIKQRPL